MRSSTRFAAFALVAALAAAPAAAQGYGARPRHGGGPDGMGMGLIPHMTKVLDLTDDQQAKISSIVARYRSGGLGDAMQASRKARFALRQTIHDLDATDAQVQNAAAGVAAAESRLAVEQHRMALEIGGVLTAEQKAKLAQIKNAPDRDDDDPPPPPDGSF